MNRGKDQDMKGSVLATALVTASLLLTACSDGDGTAPPDDQDAVTVLARADGWRDDLAIEDGFLILEIADDRATADRAWDDNVPAELAPADGDPVTPGVYGTLDDVDFTRQAVVVASSGGSSSCPPWVDGIATFEDRVEVSLTRSDPDAACTDDFATYRLVLAVERDLLPDLETGSVDRIDVPSDNLTDVTGRVVAYPPNDPGGDPMEPVDAFDRAALTARAEKLLGQPEDTVEERRDQRIVRRGEESFPVTMDHVPGRLNLELDDDGTGTFRVTRVEVEVPDGQDPLVVE